MAEQFLSTPIPTYLLVYKFETSSQLQFLRNDYQIENNWKDKNYEEKDTGNSQLKTILTLPTVKNIEQYLCRYSNSIL